MYIYGLQASCSSGKDATVNLESTSADVTVRGFVAHLTVKLVYRNNSEETVEVTYVCPVDAKAAIYSFEAKLEGRTIIAHCLEKEKAQEVYTKAVEQGHTAILGTEDSNAGDIFHLALGNLPKGETAELKLGIVLELPVGTDGAVAFTLPTVFNPRYSPAEMAHKPSIRHTGTTSTVIPNKTHYSLDVKGEVCGTLKIAKVTSETDSINVQICEEETTAKITQDGGSTLDHDWGFKIYYQTPHQVMALQMAGDRTGDGIMKDDVVMLNLFPEVPLEGFSPHNELIFVIDRSGSMEGSRIKKAKRTLLLLLKSLPHGCRFNVVSFGSSYSSLFPTSSERYTEDTLNKALQLKREMDADMGGTEILAALKHVYSQDLIPGYARQMIVMTDGAVWNQKQVFDLISRFAHETRVFSVGIGEGASTALVQGMAEAGRGRCEMVAQEDQLQTKVMGLVASMLQEPIKDLKVDWDVEPTQPLNLVPKIPPSVFGGQQVILYARLSPKTRIKSFKITWKLGDKEIISEIQENQCKIVHDSSYSFHRLAAKVQLKQWELEDKENKKELIDWSVASSVVCKETSFVGVDQDSRRIEAKAKPLDIEFQSSQVVHIGGIMPRVRCFKKPVQNKNMISLPGGNSINTLTSSRLRRSDGFVAVPLSGGGGWPKKKSKNITSEEEKIEGSHHLLSKVEETKPNRPQVTQEESSADDMDKMDCDESHASPKRPSDVLLRIVSSQNFDGSWTFESGIDFIAVSEDYLRKMQAKVSLDDPCFATAVTLAFLESHFASRKQEWQLVHIKGRHFLDSKGVDSTRVIEQCLKELQKCSEN